MIKKRGRLISVRDRKTGFEVLAAPARVILLDDPSDAWGHGIDEFGEEVGEFLATRVVLSESGSIRNVLSVVSTSGESELIQDYCLDAGSPLLAIRCHLHYKGRCQAIKWVLQPDIEQPTYTWEVPYGHVTRSAGNGEEPMQRWVDITGVHNGAICGVTVFNDNKYGADVKDDMLRITLSRSPLYASSIWTDEGDPSRRYQGQGEQEFTLWLFPHIGSWQEACLSRVAQELHEPLLPVMAASHDGPLKSEASWLEVTPENLVVPVVKLSEDGEDIILRGYEITGNTTQATISVNCLHCDWQSEVGAHEIFTLRQQQHSFVKANMLEEPADD